MLPEPNDMPRKSIDLCTKRTVKLDVFNLLQKTRADIAVDCIFRMSFVIKFDWRLFFLGNELLWLVRDLMEVVEFQRFLAHRTGSVLAPP